MGKKMHLKRSLYLKFFTALLVLAMVIGSVPVSAASGEIVVKTKKQLVKVMEKKSSATIIFRTNRKTKFIIPAIENSANKKLVMEAPNARAFNKATFKTITLNKSEYFNERGNDNSLYIKGDGVKLTVSKGIEARKVSVTATDVIVKVASDGNVGDIICNKKAAKITVAVAKNAEANITIKKTADLIVKGDQTADITIDSNADGTTITTSAPAEINANGETNVTFGEGSEGSGVRADDVSNININENSASVSGITVNGETVENSFKDEKGESEKDNSLGSTENSDNVNNDEKTSSSSSSTNSSSSSSSTSSGGSYSGDRPISGGKINIDDIINGGKISEGNTNEENGTSESSVVNEGNIVNEGGEAGESSDTEEGQIVNKGGDASENGNTSESEILNEGGEAGEGGDTEEGQIVDEGGDAGEGSNTEEGNIENEGGDAGEGGNTEEGQIVDEGGDAGEGGNTEEGNIVDEGGDSGEGGNTEEGQIVNEGENEIEMTDRGRELYNSATTYANTNYIPTEEDTVCTSEDDIFKFIYDSVKDNYKYNYLILSSFDFIWGEEDYAGVFPSLNGLTFSEPNIYMNCVTVKCTYTYSENSFHADERAIDYALSNGTTELLTADEKALYDEVIKLSNQNSADSVLETVTNIHNYVVMNIKYTLPTETEYDTQLLSTALFQGQGVCAAYAKAFYFIAKASGFDVLFVTGTAVNSNGESVPHAWNKIKIGDKWYAVDCTWDDPATNELPDGMTEESVWFFYFLIADEDMAIDHTWDNTGMPSATSRDLGSVYKTYEKVLKFASDDDAFEYIKALIDNSVSPFRIKINILTSEGSTLGDRVKAYLNANNLGGGVFGKSAGFYGMEFEVTAFYVPMVG